MRLWPDLPRPVRHALPWDAAAGALGGLASGALFPFLGVIARRDLHASAFLIALLSASASVGNLFNPLMAHHIRHRTKLPHAVWPVAAGRSCYLLMPAAVLAPVYIAICFVANALTALGAPAYAAVIRDAYPAQRRGQLMGWVRVLAVGGTIVGALVGGMFLERVSFRWVFPVAALVGLLATAAFSRIGVPAHPEEPSPPEVRLMDSLRAVRGDRVFGLYSTCFYLYGFGNLIMGPVIPIFQVDVLRISPHWVGYLATMASACSMLGYLCWGRVLDRRGPFRLMLLVIAVISISPITYLVARSVPVLLIAAAASGFAMAGGDLGYVNAAMRFGPREAAVAYAGMFAFLQACRGIPAPFIGAALGHVLGPRPVFLIALGFWAAATATLASRRGLRMAPTRDD